MEYCPRCEKYVITNKTTSKEDSLVKIITYTCSICHCFLSEVPFIKEQEDDLG